MEIFLDADLILETFLNRSGLVENVEDIFEILQGEQVRGYISELGLEKIHLIVKKLVENSEAAEEVISGIRETIEICPVNSTFLQEARSLDVADYESAVEITCATMRDISVIVTHKPQDFAGSGFPTLQVSDLWKRQYLERILHKDASSVLLVGELLDVHRLEKLLEKSSEYLRDIEITKEHSNEHRQLSNIKQNFNAQFQALINLETPEHYSIVYFVKRLLRQFQLESYYEVSSIFNEVYLRSIKIIRAGEIISNPQAWIRRVAYNVIRENSRKQIKSKSLQDKLSTLTVQPIAEEEFDNFQKQALAISLRQMQPEERLILHLRYFEELSWREVGERLACEKGKTYNVECLRKRGSRAIKRLRKIYSTVLNELHFDDNSNYFY